MSNATTKRRRVCIDRQKLAPLEVDALAMFNRRIDGKMFHFAVTRNDWIGHLTPVVTELRTGRRVCDLGVQTRYLPAFRAEGLNYRRRGKAALEALIDRCSGNSMVYDCGGSGEEYVRSVFERAPECGAEYEKSREDAK